MLEEPDPKRQKSASLEQAEEEEVNGQGKTTTANNVEDEAEETFPLQQQSRNGATVDWWQSGDARRLFAPCDNLLYEANCDVKEVVMNRIELLETVNHASRNWKTAVVDTRSHDRGASRFESYSEADIFSLRFWSMYLALALKHFVANVTGDMQTQWTWKRCLMYAIRAMNDVGIEIYSSFATLARWHRKLARNRCFFYCAPDPNTSYPPFFQDNPDAMEAFKKRGRVANLKDLSVELMYEYVHNNDLIPRLMVKRRHEDASLFDDDGGMNNHGVEEGTITGVEAIAPTTRDAILQSYGLSKLCMTTVGRWMHACGFKYKKGKSINLSMVTKDQRHWHTALYLRKDTLTLRFKHIDGFQ
ncbi:hypothetical protein MHU86_25254 [Fragilaria crotonensis]|nr:hypothetical protein MHU86_25254 [Fragilaria crotonensis]